MSRSLFLFLLPILALPASAFATTWSESDAFWVKFNFTGVAFGKTVVAVTAHAGVLRDGDQCHTNARQGYWDGTQDVKLERQGDHFFAKTRFISNTGECQVGVKGPVVQYWVVFSDGSMKITDESMIPFVDTKLVIRDSSREVDWDKSLQANDDVESQVRDATETSSTRLQYITVD